MASVFFRRFTFDPGDTVLLSIESVNILDLTPPASIAGVGLNTALLVGEFENGPFNTPQQVLSTTDFMNTWGQLGYQYGSVLANYPCAVSRSADGAITPEFWNGNGFLALNGKAFGALLLCRVDTSVGSVQFTRRGSITGVGQFAYKMSPGDHLDLDIGDTAGSFVTTFSATAATHTASGGTFPTTFTGVESLTLGYDAVPNFTVFFQAADQSLAQVVARINQFAGFAFADTNGGQVRLTSRQVGSGAQVRVVAASAGGVLTQLGLVVATYAGTGNVANIAAVSPLEVQAAVNLEMAGNAILEFDQEGNPRVVLLNETNLPGYIRATTATTATSLGFTLGAIGTATGRGILIGATAVTNPTLFAGGESLTIFDSSVGANTVVTFAAGDQTPAQVVTKINSFFASPVAYATGGGHLWLALASLKAGGTIRVVATSSGAVATTLGVVVGSSATGTVQPAGTIPAGSVVQDVPGSVGTPPTIYVTMQDVAVAASAVGPFSVKVRHAVDDGTGTSTGAGLIAKIANPVDFAAFSVTNASPTTAALTETQIDAAYQVAIDKTKSITSVAKTTNVIWAARHSNTVRRALRKNAIDASANGCFGRMACVSPPLNTDPQVALSTVAEPGVGAYRDGRTIYCYVGANVSVPLIGLRGLSGGAGFTADGTIDQTSDGWMASILSQLPPEENPGQSTPFTSAINSIEKGANVQGFEMDTYAAFKAAGIAALRFDADTGSAIFQSGVTSVDPQTDPALTRISRRRMADFIQDSIQRFAGGFGKQLGTFRRKKAIINSINGFLAGLLNKNNPGNQRIAGYTPAKDVTTPEEEGLGLFRLTTSVRTLTSLDSIVVATEVGDSVTVTTTLPQAA